MFTKSDRAATSGSNLMFAEDVGLLLTWHCIERLPCVYVL